MPATVGVSVTGIAPRSTVKACLFLNDVQLLCSSGTAFTMTGHTSRPAGHWTLTLRGAGAATPTLDARLEFPAAEPMLTIEGAWFDGAARPAYNGVAVELTPRAGPSAAVSASWDGSQAYRLTVQPEGGTAAAVDGTGDNVSRDMPVTAGAVQRIELRNTGAGAEHTSLSATIAWH